MPSVKSPKKTLGRTAKYDPKVHPKKAREYIAAGNTKASIAHAFGVHPSTICEWQNNHSEFREAINQGSKIQENLLVNDLFLMSRGYAAPDGKYVPKNLGAACFLLKNLNPNDWRDRRDVVAEVTVEEKSKSEKLDEVLALLRDAG